MHEHVASLSPEQRNKFLWSYNISVNINIPTYTFGIPIVCNYNLCNLIDFGNNSLYLYIILKHIQNIIVELEGRIF